MCSLPCGQNWSRLATCLGMDLNKSFSHDIIRFIHRRGYMIVPPSNPPNSKARFLYEEVDLLWKMPFHVRSERFHRHSAEVCLLCHMQWLRRPLQGDPLHRESTSQEMRRLLVMGGARHSSCIYFGNLK